jgi:lysosomal acid lipase/cholesteryl ester hydrolase
MQLLAIIQLCRIIWSTALDHDIFFSTDVSGNEIPLDPDVGKDMTDIVTARGYPIETHYVTTADGYILTMFHLTTNKEGKVRPVLLQHGLLDSSYTWVNNFQKQSLGYILADAGFDVWFGNNRGNKYGRNHTTLNPEDSYSEFWDFTWDEMAMFDLPSMVNYVLDATGTESISWCGHSQGTIQMFAASSSVQHKVDDAFFQRALKSINLFVALAPVVYVHNQGSMLLKFLAESGQLVQNLHRTGLMEFLPGAVLDKLGPELCSVYSHGCDFVLDSICGPSANLNTTRMQVYMSQTPAGTSTLNILHWIQGVLSPTFQRFDHGSEIKNLARYGSPLPPVYELSKLTVPTALFHGGHDFLSSPEDFLRIRKEVPADKIVHVSYMPAFSHMDFTWGTNANVEVYAEVVSLLREYNI